MGSVFLNVGLVAGVSLAALPVILHLFMRQTPKHVIFPALRLIRERQKRSRKRLRVKNWLLLLARMALLALMALALARPRIDAKASLGTGEEPSAVALVFDTSLSMGYKVRERSRLDESKERATEVLKKLNEQSKVFIIDGSDPSQPIAQSPAAARKKIEGLAIHAVNRPLNAAMGAAYSAVAEIDLPRREVYVFTDLAASQWQTGQENEGLAEARKRIKGGEITTLIFRVGAKEMRDVAIISAETSSPVVTSGEPVSLSVKLRNIGPKTTRIVELRIDGAVKEKKLIEIAAGAEVDVPPIVSSKLDTGLHRIEVVLQGEPDPLEFNDRRYLTIDVQPAIKILIVSEIDDDAKFVQAALDPDPKRERDGMPHPFQVETVRTSQLDKKIAGRSLKEFSGIFLINVRELEPSWWTKLNTYVRDGGGVTVAPAGYSLAANYNAEIAAQLLPAKLGKVIVHPPTDPPFTFGTVDLSSPLFMIASQKDLLAALSLNSIAKTWDVTADPAASRMLLRYVDNSPALLERTFPGTRPGKVLLWTTALSTRGFVDDPQYWNDFPKDDKGWAFVAIMEQTAYYLASASGQRLVVDAGEDAALPLDPNREFTSFSVQTPSATTGDRQAEPNKGQLFIASPAEIGHWTVKAAGKDGPAAVMGFSVNPPRSELQTAALEAKDLDMLFGKKGYQLAEDAESFKRVVSETTYGREIFPYIMAAILLIVTLENFLANTFYREKTNTTTPAPSRVARATP